MLWFTPQSLKEDILDELLDLPLPAFEALLEKMDQSFNAGDAAIYFNRFVASTAIDFFRRTPDLFTDNEWQIVEGVGPLFVQLVVYAFGEAPDDVVKEWHAIDRVEDAVERAETIRTTMPTAMSLWDWRLTAPGKVLGDSSVRTLVDPTADGPVAQVVLDAFMPSGIRLSPASGSRSYFDFFATKSDLRRLIANLEEAVESIESWERLSEEE